MILDFKGGDYDGETLHITSPYHPCCGTLEVIASLASVYKRWRNKLDGCPQQCMLLQHQELNIWI